MLRFLVAVACLSAKQLPLHTLENVYRALVIKFFESTREFHWANRLFLEEREEAHQLATRY